MADAPPKIDTPEKHCLVRSTCAKEGVFTAQDAADLIENDGLRRKVQQALGNARSYLELVDNYLRDSIHHGEPPGDTPEEQP